jgi:hypothetical protein
MLRREFLAVLAAIPFAPKPRTRITSNALIFEAPDCRVLTFPKHKTAIALINPGFCTAFWFSAHCYYLTYSDNDGNGFSAFRWPWTEFFIPWDVRHGFRETVYALQDALEAARDEHTEWWRDHPEFHDGLRIPFRNRPYPDHMYKRDAIAAGIIRPS